jgi:hypothetical protein
LQISVVDVGVASRFFYLPTSSIGLSRQKEGNKEVGDAKEEPN